MIKKLVIYGMFFIFLTVINICIASTIVERRNKEISNQELLEEIAFGNNLHNQFTKSSAAPLVLGEFTTDVNVSDARTANLKVFFRKYNSPLYDHAEAIVKVSDKYQFDYRLLPAIAMQESNLCKFIPENSYNCWGWGIYGTLVTRFESYDEGIEKVAAGLKKEYIDKGLVTASAIMEKYTPPSKGSWAHGVNTFLNVIQ